MMNQLGLFEIEDDDELEIPSSSSSSHMGLVHYPNYNPFGTNMISSTPTTTCTSLSLPFLCNQISSTTSPRKSNYMTYSTTTTTTIPSSCSSLGAADHSPKDQQQQFGGVHQLLSFQRSSAPINNLW